MPVFAGVSRCSNIYSIFVRMLSIPITLTLLLGIFPLWTNAKVGPHCPLSCECVDTSVRCILRGLTSVPPDIPLDTTVLDLRFNDIRSLQHDSFPHLPKLRILLLNKNNLRQIGPGAFSNLPSLAVLFVYKNRLSTISADTFSGLNSLEYLYMQHNELSSIDPGVFDPLRNLKRLHLHSNKLPTLPEGLFDELEKLEQLRIDHNPFVCDCYLRWLAEFLNKTQGLLEEQFANCAEPERLANRTVDGLAIGEMECSSPTIVRPPQDVVMRNSGEAKFDCLAEGMPKPKIIWMHNSKKVFMESDEFELQPDGSLLISKPGKKDMGSYECMAVNAFGASRSRRALLTDEHGKVGGGLSKGRGQSRRNLLSRQQRQGQESPTFLRIPADTEVDVGSQAELDCVVSGHPTPIVSWDFNGRNLEPSENVVIQSSGKLVIMHARKESAGVYACRAFSGYGHITSPKVHLRVRYPPEFTIRPSDISIGEGSETRLHCEALAYPPAIISWSKDGRILRETRRQSFDSERSMLTIYPVLREDAGSYTCHVANPIGQIQASAQIILTTSAPPKITQAPTNQAVRQNGIASFRCSAEGKPKPSIHWLFNGSPVPTIRGHYEITSEGSLFVHGVTLQDAGHYSCQAVNDVGAQTVDATLKVEVSISDNPVDSALIRSSVAQATTNVDRAINSTQEHLYSSGPKTPSELLTIFRFPGPQARELARVREIYDETLSLIQQHVQQGLRFNLTDFSYQNLLSESHLMLIAELSGCHIHRDSQPCTDICLHTKYRTYDGTCNNFQHPMWGSSLTPFRRLLPPIYENGFNLPVGATSSKRYHGYPKPNARLVSMTVIKRDSGIVPQDEEFTHMLMQWGQFTDHDIDFGVAAPSTAVFQSGRDCSQSCDDPNRPPCFNIPLPEDDTRRQRGHQCMEFERTGAICGSGATSVLMNTVMPREQVNVITSFLDGSNVYGSNEQDALEIRDLFSDHGLLKFDVVSHTRKPYLPFNRNTPIDCQRNVSQPQSVRCFLAGDYRANEQLGLLAMHTIWHREHNRIAGNFLVVNPHWDGEKIYQETRKIVGAMLQHITFQHWLPNILGPEGMRRIGPYQGYKPEVNPAISNVFATGAFRFGHSLINPIMFRLNSTFQEIPEGHLPLHKAFFSPDKLLNEGGTDPLLRGLFATPAKKLTPDSMLNSELTERLFSAAHHVSLDLAALNIQRGRDHALPGYSEWRQYCNLSVPNSWLDLRQEIPNIDLLQRLQQVYGHPGNMDVWMGGLAEKLVPGAKVGPLFMCIIADQFKRIRDGDRFWHEHEGVFDTVRLAELKKTTLSKVMCNNGDAIDRVPRDAFRFQDTRSFVRCQDIDDINFHLWQDCCSSDSCNQLYEYAVSNSPDPSTVPRRTKRRVAQEEKCSNSPDNMSVTKKILRDMDQTFEERIEALEDLVVRMSKELNSKLAQESEIPAIGIGSTNARTAVLANCTDTTGQVHPGATEWENKDGCEVCTCLNGTIFCRIATDCH